MLNVNVGLAVAAILFSLSAFADFEELTVTCKTAEDGTQQICVKPFPALKSTQPNCILVTKSVAQKLDSSDDLHFTELKLEALGVAGDRFGAAIEWKGKGSGTLGITGPRGRIFAVGSIASDGNVSIEQFSDEALSQQVDRGVLFGESDPIRLHAKTKIWLEELLVPVLKTYLASPEIKHP